MLKPVALLLLVLASCKAERPHVATSDYVGEERRDIKSLSPRDVEELLAGKGWGFAKAAELNGVAGPRHVVELEAQVELSPEQRVEIDAVFEEMERDAQRLGLEFVAAERALSAAFAGGPPSLSELDALVAKSGSVRAKLRTVHLRAHLRTHAILTREQRREYVDLRGYESLRPCAAVPKGHDPQMWRRHHNCD